MKDVPVRQLKGIGPKTAEQFAEIGLESTGRLVRYYPADYECMEAPVPLRDAVPGQVQAHIQPAGGRYEHAAPPAPAPGLGHGPEHGQGPEGPVLT